MDLNELKRSFDVNEIIGKPIEIDRQTTIVPISKISYGYVSGQSDFGQKKEKENKNSVDAKGFGMTVTPLGILMCSGQKNNYIKIDENYGDDKWMNLLKSAVSALQK